MIRRLKQAWQLAMAPSVRRLDTTAVAIYHFDQMTRWYRDVQRQPYREGELSPYRKVYLENWL